MRQTRQQSEENNSVHKQLGRIKAPREAPIGQKQNRAGHSCGKAGLVCIFLFQITAKIKFRSKNKCIDLVFCGFYVKMKRKVGDVPETQY